MHSTPRASRALALGLEGSRVMPRSLNSLAVVGSSRIELTTDPPWNNDHQYLDV